MTLAARRWEDCSREEQECLRVLWGAGDLAYKLHVGQLAVHETWTRTTGRIFALDCARRWGKTFFGLVIDIEAALRHPNARIPVAAPEQKQVREIITPLIRHILADCPPELRPSFNKVEGAWTFANGARMVVAGLDINPDALRGVYADHAHVIEAAYVRDLEYVVQSVLVPQMQGRPHARIFMESTPPTSPLHPWSVRYVPACKASGDHARQTIEDNPLLTPAEVAEFNALAGGRDHTTCRRENYAEHVVDDEAAIVPEFRVAKNAEPSCVREVERPEYFDAYVSMDPGQVDLWAVLFALYDFPHARLVVEDEIVVNRQTTSFLAAQIRAKEAELWGKPPVRRVSDTALQTICDLQNDHGITFIPTAKDDKLAAINNLRLWIQRGRVVIHPRCKTLIAHLEFGVWNERRTEYERVEGHGHFDAIDALVYMVRNIDERRNPFPAIHPSVTLQTHFVPPHAQPEAKGLAKMFGPKFAAKGAAGAGRR